MNKKTRLSIAEKIEQHFNEEERVILEKALGPILLFETAGDREERITMAIKFIVLLEDHFKNRSAATNEEKYYVELPIRLN